jgi:hypothetical protein
MPAAANYSGFAELLPPKDQPMFVTRPTAPRFKYSLAAVILATSFARSAAAQSGAEWRPAGVTRPTNAQSTASASTDSAWQSPNGQQAAAASQVGDQSNPLRQKQTQKSAAAPPEPRAFQPPGDVKRIAAAQPAVANQPKPQLQAQRQTPLAAAAKAPAASSKVHQAYAQPRPMPANRPAAPQQPAHQRVAKAKGQRYGEPNDPTDKIWDAINVAFQGEPTPKSSKSVMKQDPEDLPLPSGNKPGMQDPVMRHFDGPGGFVGPYDPYGEMSGSYGDGCSDPCGCGSACEPGCGCEPGCSCEPGCTCDNCNNRDLFCIGPGDDESCHTVRLRWPKWQEVTVFAGAQGFKGPYDQERDSGNFGFNEGFNIGAKVPYAELGYQFGMRNVHSQLNGDKDTGIDESHFQTFATAGLFHRSCEGLQFGVVWDALNDERYHSRQFHQLRSEISILNCGHEFGFTGSFGTNDHRLEDENDEDIFFEASDQYLLFYRLHGCNGGEGRLFAGFNDDSDGIVGSDMLIPIGDRFSVQSGFTYLIPNERNGTAGATQEAWNIGMGLVWHWDRQARKSFDNCYRPFFNVADNGSLIVDQRNGTNNSAVQASQPEQFYIDYE